MFKEKIQKGFPDIVKSNPLTQTPPISLRMTTIQENKYLQIQYNNLLQENRPFKLQIEFFTIHPFSYDFHGKHSQRCSIIHSNVKVKVKLRPITGHEGPEGE